MGDARDIAGAFRGSDQAGLAAAIILHAALAALLVAQINLGDDPPEPVREGISVSLASEVSLESTAPDPVAEARAATAPVVGDQLPEPDPVSEPEPRRPDDPPRPTPRATNKPRTDRTPTPRNTSTPKTPTKTPTKTPPKNPGSTDFDNAFGPGSGSNPDSDSTGTPAKNLGPSELASLRDVVARQVRIKWLGRVPQGPDAEKLVTRVTFKLNPDGSLLGNPRVVRTTGQTDLNRNQVGRHQEEAIKAIRLVGRFRLPFEVPAAQNTFTFDFDR